MQSQEKIIIFHEGTVEIDSLSDWIYDPEPTMSP